MLATSWNATGLVRDAWLRLDVPKGHREELARLTGIPATSLSAMNTGHRPMTMAQAERIAAAVPGLTLLDLGAREEEANVEHRSIVARLEEAEAALNDLGPQLERLARRVAALEREARTKKKPAATRRTKAAR